MTAISIAAQDAKPQQAPPQPKPRQAQESPADLYLRAMQPVETVRRSPNNVTEFELGAWGVAVTTAAHACAAHKVGDFSGEDLFHFARLCNLGQQYDDAADAASKYVKEGNTKSAESARALIVRAYLSAGNPARAERAAHDLMANHPYDGTVHTMVQEVILALAATDAVENALALVQRRSEPLMAVLAEGTGLPLHEGSYRVPQSMLVRDTLSAVYLYRLEGRMSRGQESADALIDTVRKMVADSTGSSSAVDRDAMQAALRRAEMLKVDAPLVAVELSSAKTIVPRSSISYDKNITVLAFYAPWSPQRTQMFELLGKIARDYKIFPVQIFALTTSAIATGDSSADPADIVSKLLESVGKAPPPVPIVLTTDAVIGAFAVDDWPMFVVVDQQGKVRFLDTLIGSEYKDGGRMHRLVAGLASQAGPLPQPPPKAKSGKIKVPEGTLQHAPK